MNFADAQCLASREFGTPEKPLTLFFKAPATGDVVQLGVIRQGTQSTHAEQVDGKVRFGQLPETKRSVLTYSPDKVDRRVFLFNLPGSEVAGWTGNQALSLTAGSRLNESFALSGMASMLTVMNECVADLRKQWNFSEKDGPSVLKQHAAANLVRYFDTSDYPDVAVYSGD